MRALLLLPFCLVLSGCTLGNINSIYRSPTLKYGSSHIVDAKQRFVLTYPGLLEYNNMGEVVPRQTVSCAEPSPDVFSVYAASGEAAVNLPNGAAGSGSFSSTETGASLLDRTTSLQALRDNYFRLCEGYANGAIDEIDFMIGQRHNQTALIGLIAIEEMKMAARAPAVVIGGSASATSASGIRETSEIIRKTIEDNQRLAEETAVANARVSDLTTKEIPQAKEEADQALPPNPTDADKQKKQAAEAKHTRLTTEKGDLEKANKAREAKTETNDKVIAALTKSMENGGATGATARSIVQEITKNNGSNCNSCGTQQATIAQQMANVVKMIDDNDFGPTICLTYLRKATPGNVPLVKSEQKPTGKGKGVVVVKQSAMTQVCRQVMDEYVAGLKNRRETARILAEALAKNPSAVTPQSIAAVSAYESGGGAQIFGLTGANSVGTGAEEAAPAEGAQPFGLNFQLEGKAKFSADKPKE